MIGPKPSADSVTHQLPGDVSSNRTDFPPGKTSAVVAATLYGEYDKQLRRAAAFEQPVS
jgi:hypothetical protein